MLPSSWLHNPITYKLINIHYTKMLLPAATKLWPRLCFYVCVILFTGGVSGQGEPPQAGRTPPGRENHPPRSDPPRSRHPPGLDTPRSRHPPNPPGQGDTPPGSRHPPGPDPPGPDPPRDQTPPPPGSTLQHTVNERPVRILLECILVLLV